MINIGVIGAGGLVAEELLKILLKHNKVNIKYLHSETYKGKKVQEVLPAFKKISELLFSAPPLKEIKEKCDCVFIAKGHGEASEIVKGIYSSDLKIIDVSADFRLPDIGYYKKWYPKTEHKAPELLKEAVYGLSEINTEKIKKANLIANPGCYPTAVNLSLAPLIKNKFLKTGKLIVNAFSGVSGAGRQHKEKFNLFTDINENMKIYKAGTHQHTPEIEMVLSGLAGKEITATFIPCLIPVNRGILAVTSHQLDKKIEKNDVIKMYKEFYINKPFIRIYEEGLPDIQSVNGTNFCDIGFEIDDRNNTLIIVSCIDNMIKGAAGQAVQNMNLMFDFNETEGLF